MDALVKKHLHSQAKIAGVSCDTQGLEQLIVSWTKSKEVYLQKTAQFLSEWLSPQETITLHTSGTTGIPKLITVKKAYMIRSAMLTGAFLQPTILRVK